MSSALKANLKDILNLDLYDLLQISHNASVSEVKKAYRKQALKCHPDKNPDKPDAVEQFHLLSAALEVLTDEAAKAQYDRVLRGRKAAAIRTKELDAKRRKLKEDLDAREKAATDDGRQGKSKAAPNKTAEERLWDIIEKLRKEGSKELKREQELMKEKLEKEQRAATELLRERRGGQGGQQTVLPEDTTIKLKAKWNAKRQKDQAAIYDEETLRRIFVKYGEINFIIVSEKRKGRALIEFASNDSAHSAFQLEKGFADCPLHLEIVGGDPPSETDTIQGDNVPSGVSNAGVDKTSFSSVCDPLGETDFESMVLTKMKQAAERKRLTEMIKREDQQTDSMKADHHHLDLSTSDLENGDSQVHNTAVVEPHRNGETMLSHGRSADVMDDDGTSNVSEGEIVAEEMNVEDEEDHLEHFNSCSTVQETMENG